MRYVYKIRFQLEHSDPHVEGKGGHYDPYYGKYMFTPPWEGQRIV